MNVTRQMWFWVLTVVVGAVALWLLREILLPFVAGMALAYLLDPLANRLERIGINRLAATLEHPGHREVGVGRPDHGVHHEEYGIGGERGPDHLPRQGARGQ